VNGRTPLEDQFVGGIIILNESKKDCNNLDWINVA
jgi:hypothetical protein